MYFCSVKNGCQWNDCLSITNQGTEMAMVANLIKISVQKFKTRLYYLNTSAINVSVPVVCELSAELTVNIVGCVSDHAVFAFYDCAFRQSAVNTI